MKNNFLVRHLVSALCVFVFPVVAAAQEKGLDERIDAAFKPIADGFEAIVFYLAPLPAPFNIPIVLYLLIGGATFFTIAFGFINFRRFPLAINVVRGKYDDIEMAADADHEEPHSMKSEVEMTEEGDILRTIKG